MYCSWRSDNKLMQQYHDNVFSIVKVDTNVLFKWLILEQAQAGLSWQTIINREQSYDDFFENYDIIKIMNMDFEMEKNRFEQSNIIKNKLKFKAIIFNARLIYEIEKELPFIDYLKNIDPNFNIDNIVKVLKKDGFKFIGYEIVKSFYESVGLINGHEPGCIKGEK